MLCTNVSLKAIATAVLALVASLALLTTAPSANPTDTPAAGPDGQTRHHAVYLVRPPKFPADFKHFDWVNPDAPKGGTLKLAEIGSYDSLNAFARQGEKAEGLTLINETLMDASPDESSTEYARLAEWISYPADYSSATFKLREGIKFHDGHPITPEDVIWSLTALKEANPLFKYYYKNVVAAEQTGDREVTFRFDVKNNRELPLIVGQMIYVLPKHFWTGKDASGRQRDLSKSTLEPPLGSGPYKIKSFDVGRAITYERVEDYWGKDLPLLRGQYNFNELRYTYYRDRTPAFEAFKEGKVDFWMESSARYWATQYDRLMRTGLVRKEAIKTYGPWSNQAFVFNLRRKQFQDPRVRRAFNLTFDFEFFNKASFNGLYERVNSYFDGGELRARGVPQGRELEILNEIRDQVPVEVFTGEWLNPVNNTREDYRRHIAEAMRLLNEADWLVGTDGLLRKDGETLKAEFLMAQQSDTMIDLVTNFVTDLKKLGIDAKIRVVDSAQYQRRVRQNDFDVFTDNMAQSDSPGNEQREYWGSAAADTPGSQNNMGLKDPAIDKLIEKIIFAQTRDELVAATNALDRVLRWKNLIIPQWYYPYERIAYWDYFGRPEKTPALTVSATRTWWFDPEKRKALEAKRRAGQ